jgi:hypothetical protein
MHMKELTTSWTFRKSFFHMRELTISWRFRESFSPEGAHHLLDI